MVERKSHGFEDQSATADWMGEIEHPARAGKATSWAR
jgi:hypothetical protein